MKSMHMLVYEYLKEHGKRSFEQIYEHVKSITLPWWKERFTDLDESQIDQIKVGELYTLLSIDGDFSRQNEELWTLTETLTYEELKQSKIKVPENAE